MSKPSFNFHTRVCVYTEYTIVHMVYYPKNRRELLQIYKNIRKHRYLLINEGYGVDGTKTKIWGSYLRGSFDTRKNRLYLQYTLRKGKPTLRSLFDEED